MRAKIYVLYLFLCVFFLFSCKKVDDNLNKGENITQENDTENTKPDNEQLQDVEFPPHFFLDEENPSYLGPKPRTFKEFSDIYEGYDIITYVNDMYILKDDVIDEINNYLIEQGSPYVVWWKKSKNLIGNLVNGDNADIIFSGFFDPYFDDMVKRSLLIPFDEYLNSDEGRKLYTSMPKTNWNAMKRNDSIYGVNGYSTSILAPPSYIVNKSLMEKYGINEADLNKPLNELFDTLKIVAEGEKDRENFSVISTEVDYHLSGLYNVTNAVVLNQEEGKAHLLLDNDYYIDFLRNLYDSYKIGLINQMNNDKENIDNFFIYISFNSGFLAQQPQMGRFKNSNGHIGDTSTLLEIVLNGYDYYTTSTSFANAVPVSSKHPEHAFDFLNKVYTDSYLTNLFLYGIEGVNYELVDGKVNNSQPLAKLIIGNDYISYPLSYEFSDKGERYYSIKDSAIESLYTPQMYNLDGLDTKINDTNIIINNKLAQLLQDEVEDFDTFISEAKESLISQGAQDIIDEVNKQLGY